MAAPPTAGLSLSALSVIRWLAGCHGQPRARGPRAQLAGGLYTVEEN